LRKHQVQPIEETSVYEDLRAEIQPLDPRYIYVLGRWLNVLLRYRFVHVRDLSPLKRRAVNLHLRRGAHDGRCLLLVRRHPQWKRVSFVASSWYSRKYTWGLSVADNPAVDLPARESAQPLLCISSSFLEVGQCAWRDFGCVVVSRGIDIGMSLEPI